MKKYILYVHIAPNNKKYFGITCKSIKERWGIDGGGYKTQQLFWRAIQKYGWNNFQHIVLAENLSKEWACRLEQDLIWKYQSNNPKYGYNITAGGDGTIGHKLTGESLERVRQAHLGKKLSEEHKRKISESEKGKIITEEHKRKISIANSGKKLSEEHRKRLSESHKGYSMPDAQRDKIRQSLLGREFSEDWRKNLSNAMRGKPSPNKGKKMSDEQKRKIGEANKKRWAEAKLANPNYSRCISESTRKKLSDAGKKASHGGKKLSEETRRKMSESHKRRWENRKNENAT